MLQASQRNRQLHWEALENRNLLAGNVLVSVTAGDLVISGDSANNGIEILSTTNPGEYTIKGTFVNSVTKINGGTNVITVSGVTDDFNINLNGGHDKIKIGSFARTTKVPDDLTLNSQVGNDTIILQRVLADSLFSTLGSATDEVANADSVSINSSNFRTGKINTGAGNDIVNLIGSKFRQQLDLDTGLGADIVSNSSVVAGIVNLTLGGAEADNDELTATKATITDKATIFLGGGNDTVTFSEAKVTNRVTLDLGAGDDTGIISSSSADEVHLYCGQGNDTGMFTGPLTVRNVFARGGDGIDTGNAENTNDINVTGDYDVDEFESGDL